MSCPCPRDEWRAVYLGGANPIAGRYVCALCGEFVYEAPAASAISESMPAARFPQPAHQEGETFDSPFLMPSILRLLASGR